MKHVHITLTFFINILIVKELQCVKVLGVFALPARSHYNLGSALMKGLAEKGHDVTIVSAFADKSPPKNGTYREIVLNGLYEKQLESFKGTNFYELEDVNLVFTLPFMISFMQQMTENILKHPKVGKLLNSDEKFDVVIVQQFDAHRGFGQHFNAPLIILSTLPANTLINNIVANPEPLSYVPNIFLSYSSDMSFYERVVNSLFYIYLKFVLSLYFYPKEKKLYEEYFPGCAPFSEVFYNTSLILLNSHPSMNQPVPLVPNMIEIGGFHLQPPKRLPKELQKFLDEAEDGVIYFSMGSNLRSADFPQEKRDAFLKSFSKLKQKVLWKWEEDTLPGQPPNVKLGKWLPQQDILAHPNVKLFITHGGLLSTTETIYHGVPVLAIPILGDQKINARGVVNQGVGLVLDYTKISEETLSHKLDEILNNPKYSEVAKMRSQLFRDRQVKPLDSAIYWIEYVARYRGSPHLKVAGVDLSWYEYFLLDVMAIILVSCLFIIYISFKTLKVIISYCIPSKNKKIKQN